MVDITDLFCINFCLCVVVVGGRGACGDGQRKRMSCQCFVFGTTNLCLANVLFIGTTSLCPASVLLTSTTSLCLASVLLTGTTRLCIVKITGGKRKTKPKTNLEMKCYVCAQHKQKNITIL